MTPCQLQNQWKVLQVALALRGLKVQKGHKVKLALKALKDKLAQLELQARQVLQGLMQSALLPYPARRTHQAMFPLRSRQRSP